ncbi:MAG: hypothetical protein PVH65_10100 [Chloroflexota bacterium]
MNEQEKLRILIPHWIEHNEEHAGEFRRWSEHAGEAVADVLEAAAAMAQVNNSLAKALEKLGGPLGSDHNHHHA